MERRGRKKRLAKAMDSLVQAAGKTRTDPRLETELLSSLLTDSGQHNVEHSAIFRGENVRVRTPRKRLRKESDEPNSIEQQMVKNPDMTDDDGLGPTRIEQLLLQQLTTKSYILLLQLLNHVPPNFKAYRANFIRWVYTL